MTRLAARLAALDRDQLVALVGRLVDADPDLADLVHMPLPGETRPLDTAPLTARVTTILRTMGDDWRASYRARFDLYPVVAIAEERLRAGALDDARRAYRAIIDAILARYEQVRDEESEIAGLVNDCVTALGHVLDATTGPADRAVILRDIFDVFVWDRIQHGGYGMTDAVQGLLVGHTSAEERQLVLDWLAAVRPTGGTREVRWGRRAAGELTLAVLGPDADPDRVEEVLRWSGLTHLLVQRLLAAGRHADAVDALAGASDELLRCADLLVAAGYGQEAVRAVASHRQHLDDEYNTIPSWLAKHGYDASGVEALGRAVRRFRLHPTIGEWDRVRAEAERLGFWAEAAPRLLAAVDDSRTSVQPVRARALAAVGRLDEAVAVHAGLPDSAKTTCGVSIARDAAKVQPDIARTLLQAAIERLAGRKARAVREERERLEQELAGLPRS